MSLALCAGITFSSFGQEVVEDAKPARSSSGTDYSFTSMNGHEVLPQAGEYALGIGASPIITFAGNMFGFTNSNSQNPFAYASKGFPTAVIYGKYMKSGDVAYRGSININIGTTTNMFVIDNDYSDNPDDLLSDSRTYQASSVLLGAGLEKRRGESRVQGIYGAEGFLYYSTGDQYTYEYANPITLENQTPESTAFGNPTTLGAPAEGYRIVNAKMGNTVGIGARAFVGVEYFIAPKISLGGEFNWGVALMNYGSQEVTFEAWEGESDQVVGHTLSSINGSSVNVSANNLGGNVNILFYF